MHRGIGIIIQLHPRCYTTNTEEPQTVTIRGIVPDRARSERVAPMVVLMDHADQKHQQEGPLDSDSDVLPGFEPAELTTPRHHVHLPASDDDRQDWLLRTRALVAARSLPLDSWQKSPAVVRHGFVPATALPHSTLLGREGFLQGNAAASTTHPTLHSWESRKSGVPRHWWIGAADVTNDIHTRAANVVTSSARPSTSPASFSNVLPEAGSGSEGWTLRSNRAANKDTGRRICAASEVGVLAWPSTGPLARPATPRTSRLRSLDVDSCRLRHEAIRSQCDSERWQQVAHLANCRADGHYEQLRAAVDELDRHKKMHAALKRNFQQALELVSTQVKQLACYKILRYFDRRRLQRAEAKAHHLTRTRENVLFHSKRRVAGGKFAKQLSKKAESSLARREMKRTKTQQLWSMNSSSSKKDAIHQREMAMKEEMYLQETSRLHDEVGYLRYENRLIKTTLPKTACEGLARQIASRHLQRNAQVACDPPASRASLLYCPRRSNENVPLLAGEELAHCSSN